MSPFGVYVRLFAEAVGEDYSRFRKRFTSHHVKMFETRISNWVTSNGDWTRQHVVALMFFCHYHNPLMLSSLQEYGNLDNVGKCVALFNRWMRAYEDRVEAEGLLKTVIDTAPAFDEEVRAKSLTYEEVKALYG